ncbi:hypothetical protein DPEC_G00080410 [Dallia pectoralis]|uniref:Uncharacterized protein n=1 Tax=Dallia pectoralis TaxID=75939 RepID=A0ACC2H4M5_DALPE|nr:hypothetical protein DPEC_G00080410 [Dallia pectoralis]
MVVVEVSHAGNMKILLLFGLVAAVLAEMKTFDGEKVFRLTPETDEHVLLIKKLADNIELDFWRPESVDLVTIDMDVDIHVPPAHTDIVFTMLQQSGMKMGVLIEDVQAQMEEQLDNEYMDTRAHSYTKYNTWDTVRHLLSL